MEVAIEFLGSGNEPAPTDEAFVAIAPPHPDSLTDRLFENPEDYLGHLKNRATRAVLYTGLEPNFDELTALYLARMYLEQPGPLPRIAGILAGYVRDSARGRFALDLVFPCSPASMMLAIAHLERARGGDPNTVASRIVRESFRFLEEVFRLLQRSGNPWARDFLQELEGFEEVLALLREDARAYLNDIQNSRFYSLPLVNLETGIRESVHLILTPDPRSFLWNYWVRGDRNHSPGGNGFAAGLRYRPGSVEFPARDIELNIDPATPYSFKGLGVLLEQGEREAATRTSSSPPVEFPTLWDAGAATAFRIVRGPVQGSRMSAEEILDSIFRYELWETIGQQSPHHVADGAAARTREIPAPLEEHELNEILARFKPDEFQRQLVPLGPLEDAAWRLKAEICADDLSARQRENRRGRIVDCLIEYNNHLPTPRAHEWRRQVCELLVALLSPAQVESFLLGAEHLDAQHLEILLTYLTTHTPVQRIAPLLLALQTRHEAAFAVWIKDTNARTSQQASGDPPPGDPGLAPLLRSFAARLSVPDVSSHTREALPIYAFDRFKNHFDDMLLAADMTGDGQPDAELNAYRARDFVQLWETQESPALNDHDFSRVLSTFFRLFRWRVHSRLFGEDLKHFHGVHTLMLARANIELLGPYQRYSSEDFFTLNYEQIVKCYDYMRSRRSENETVRAFLDYLKLIKDIKAFEILFDRLRLLFSLRTINQDPELNPFFSRFHPDLLRFQEFLVLFLEAAVIHANTTRPELYPAKLEAAETALNDLKLLRNSSPFFDIFPALDDLYHFVSNLQRAEEIPPGETGRHIDLAFDQYQLIAKTLLPHATRLPGFYREILREALYAYKRFFQESIDYYREHMIQALDSPTEEIFLENCNHILHRTVFFDWLEMKQLVDETANPTTAAAFYQRYFSWRRFESAGAQPDAQTASRINRINSEVRSRVGAVLKGFGSLLGRVRKLPPRIEKISWEEHLRFLAYRARPIDLLNHFPLQLYLRSYDTLTDDFLAKFDIRAVSRSLQTFSLRFSCMYRFLTNANVLRGLVLGLFAMLGFTTLVRADGSTMPDGDRSAQLLFNAARLLRETLGARFHAMLSGGLDVFWMTFFGLLFLGPLWLLLVLQYRKYLAGRGDNTRGFVGLFEKIEAKKPSLLLVQFITPLLLVLMETFKSNLLHFINAMGLYNYAAVMLVLILIINFSIYRDIFEANTAAPAAWIFHRARHLFWLYFLQAALVCMFLINILAHFPEFPGRDKLADVKEGRFIAVQIPLISYQLYLLPKLTLLVSTLSLFMSLFLKRVFRR